MIIKPRVRGFICITAHPAGCAANLANQIRQVEAQGPIAQGPKSVLVIGASGGYGLPSRILAAFGCKAATLGVSFEKPPTETKTGSGGWYHTKAFDHAAAEAGLWSHSLDQDAFAHSTKDAVIDTIKTHKMPPIDLVVYSLASPVRQDPDSETLWRSAIKPIGDTYHVKSLNVDKAEIIDDLALAPATDEEIADTVKVMGGEDWVLWMQALDKAGALAEGVRTVAYTYIGSEVTWPIYKNGTLGHAKQGLDRAAAALRTAMQSHGGDARVVALKAVVTQASAAIPVVPLYASILFQVMKDAHQHEDCITHIDRLFRTQLTSDARLQLDADGRIRMDGAELADDVQAKIATIWQQVSTENLRALTDFDGFRSDFLRIFGFGLDEIDYEADISPLWHPGARG